MIGAGGYTFPLRLVRDLLAFESAQDATFALTDIDPVGLERTRRLTERLIDGHGLTTRVAASLDRRAMLRDADVVLVTFQVGGLEAYRHDVEIPRRLTGHFHTESSHHASEYLPYFRRTPDETLAYLPERWDYLRICEAHDPAELEREVQPTHVGRLPEACAAINLGSIAVQSCAVRAVQERSRELVHAAVALDPLTAAVLPLERIHAMVEELLAAEAAWLPRL